MIENFKINDVFCRVYKPDDENIDQILVTVHGFSGDKDSSVICALGEMLTKRGVLVISFDLPCHGEDSCLKPLSLERCQYALEMVINYAKSKHSNDKISIFATSFGAFLTLNYLSKHKEKFKNVILRAPAINMPEILHGWIFEQRGLSDKELQEGVNFGFEKPLVINDVFYNELKNVKLIENFHDELNNFHVLQGLKDDIVDANVVFKFCENNLKNRCSIYKFENADHRFKKEAELERILEITKNILFC